MAITNKLITFNKLTSFETQLAQGNILDTSIVFIKDAKKIWTKGTYFDCSGGGSNNIAIYETTDDVYNGVLNDAVELRQLLSNNSIYTLVIIQKSSVTSERTFVFNSSDKRAPMNSSITYTCVYSEADSIGNTTNLIFYQIARTEGGIILNKHLLALKSDIPNTDDFALKSEIPDTSNLATQANLTSAVTQLTTNLAKKQDKLVSGTNIATINSSSILGSGNFDLATSEQLRSFQPKLVSGTSIKTINGESILGSGDIVISGGGGKEIVEVPVSSGTIAFTGHVSRPSFEPNKIYYATSVVLEAILISSVVQPTDDVGEYTLHFTTTEDELWAGILSFEAPSNWLWANGEMPSLETNTHYELSVVATKLGTDYIYKAVLTPFKSV